MRKQLEEILWTWFDKTDYELPANGSVDWNPVFDAILALFKEAIGPYTDETWINATELMKKLGAGE